MNDYDVYFHVNDNEVTSQYNENMLIGADSPEEVMQEFKRRIDEEFDFGFSAVDLDSLEVYEGKYDYDKEPIEIPNISDYKAEQENSRKNDCIEHD
ncbi:MAG: hypothetical protein K2K16_04865 [Ruminococcus sp.]|nr:hypothetical protein [Ruminococcus sp.]